MLLTFYFLLLTFFLFLLNLMPTAHNPPCDDILILKEKVASLEDWRRRTEADLKDIRDIISQVKLLMTLSLGGGGLSIITLLVTIVTLARGVK